MAVAESTAAPFSIGRVVNTIFAVIGRNLVPFLLLAMAATAPAAVFGVITGGDAEATATNAGSGFWITFVISMFLGVFFGFLLQAVLTYSTLLDLNGERPSIGKAVNIALKAVVPLFVLGIIYSLGVGLAMILLIIPGLILLTAWAVCVPAFISENTGITGALKRSAELTKGYRWPIFGLALIYGVIVTAGSMAQGVALAMMTGIPGGAFVVALIVQTIFAVLGATGAAVIY